MSGQYISLFPKILVASLVLVIFCCFVEPVESSTLRIRREEQNGGATTTSTIGQQDPISVSNKDELTMALARAKPGDIIYIKQGEYIGNFLLAQNSVTLQGYQGPQEFQGSKIDATSNFSETILRTLDGDENPAITVSGQDCSVENLKVVVGTLPKGSNSGILISGGHASITNVAVEGGWAAVFIHSKGENKLTNVSITNATNGVHILGGDGNEIFTSSLENIRTNGIYLQTNKNKIEGLIARNVKMGAMITGNENKVSDFLYEKGDTERNFYCGVSVGGKGTRINKMSCKGLEQEKGDTGVDVRGMNTQISNTTCPPIEIRAREVNLLVVH